MIMLLLHHFQRIVENYMEIGDNQGREKKE